VWQWRKLLEHFVITLHKDCIKALSQVVVVVVGGGGNDGWLVLLVWYSRISSHNSNDFMDQIN